MKRFSDKRQRQEIRSAKLRDKIRAEDPRCFFFPGKPGTEIHHICPRSQNTSLIDNKENLVALSFKAHEIIHTGTTADLRALPAGKFRAYLDLMKRLDPVYHSRFLMKFM